MQDIDQKIKNELDTVYITTDGRKFLKYMEALYAQTEIESGVERKLSKQKRIMNIVEIMMNVLKSENWGVYYKNQPMQPLEMQDGNPLYKINQVDDSDIEQAIINMMEKGNNWDHSQANIQKKNSEAG